MNSKTKIVVLHLKELIYTGIFALLGILFIVLIALIFIPAKTTEKPDLPQEKSFYVPGKYTTSLQIGESSVDVEVTVDRANITSVRLVNLTQVVSTIYPLMEPCMDTIAAQICEKQSLEGLVYPDENKYTSQLLIDAVGTALDKAKLSEPAL